MRFSPYISYGFCTCSSNLSAISWVFLISSEYISALAVASMVACDSDIILLLMESILIAFYLPTRLLAAEDKAAKQFP